MKTSVRALQYKKENNFLSFGAPTESWESCCVPASSLSFYPLFK